MGFLIRVCVCDIHTYEHHIISYVLLATKKQVFPPYRIPPINIMVVVVSFYLHTDINFHFYGSSLLRPLAQPPHKYGWLSVVFPALSIL